MKNLILSFTDLKTSLLVSILFLSLLNISTAQIDVSEEGDVRIGDIRVSSEGDVKMGGLGADSDGNVELGDISVSADGSVIMTGLRVEANGSISMGSNFNGDTLGDAIDDPGDAANLIVFFKSGSSELSDRGREQVEQIAEAISYLGGNAAVEIQGHTDSIGADADNLVLSIARAEQVAIELRDEHGVTAKLTTVGKGEAEPVAGNDSNLGRQLNRRVTLVNRS